MLRRRFRHGVLEKISTPAGRTFVDLGPIEFRLSGALRAKLRHIVVRNTVLVGDRRPSLCRLATL